MKRVLPDSPSDNGKRPRPNGNVHPPGAEPHHIRRLLCCGLHDDRDIQMFKDALVEVDGDVDILSLHTTDPAVVADYRRRFCPDFVVLANEERELPDPPGTAKLLRAVAETYPVQPGLGVIVAQRLDLGRPLTKRQLELFEYLRNGCTNRKIAEYMHVQPRTVKEWLKELYLVFFVSNRTELVARVDELSHDASTSQMNDGKSKH